MEKDHFLEKLEDILTSINGEGIIIGSDLECHLGADNTGYEEVMGLYGYGFQSKDGIAPLDVRMSHHLKVASTIFRRDPEKLITYKSGSVSKQFDIILQKSRQDISLTNCNVIPGEECLTRHFLVRADFKLKERKEKRGGELRKSKSGDLRIPICAKSFPKECLHKWQVLMEVGKRQGLLSSRLVRRPSEQKGW